MRIDWEHGEDQEREADQGRLDGSPGQRSASPEFRKIVNLTLSRSGRFERIGRGRYFAQ